MIFPAWDFPSVRHSFSALVHHIELNNRSGPRVCLIEHYDFGIVGIWREGGIISRHDMDTACGAGSAGTHCGHLFRNFHGVGHFGDYDNGTGDHAGHGVRYATICTGNHWYSCRGPI